MTNTLAPDSKQEAQEIGASKAQGSPADRYTGGQQCLAALLGWHASIKRHRHQCRASWVQLQRGQGHGKCGSLEVASPCLHRACIAPSWQVTGLLSNNLKAAGWEQLLVYMYFWCDPISRAG